MKKELITTEDGSHSLYIPEMDENYHSTHGAWTESMHIFIKHGFNFMEKNDFSILEIGLGTGLNALLTCHFAEQNSKKVYFHSLEAFPIEMETLKALNFEKKYNDIFPEGNCQYQEIIEAEWNKSIEINSFFSLYKNHIKLENWKPVQNYDLIYFDAFAPEKQPNMWSQEIFDQMFKLLNSNGVLATYCAKGVVKRMLKSAGFTVKNYPGPPGKREITVAFKKD